MMIEVARAIHDAKRIPSGHLYAVLCGEVTLAGYENLIRTLVRAGLVRVQHDELIW